MIDDSELMLFHWRDGLDAARRREIADALARDAALAARYTRLMLDMEKLGQVPEPVPDALRVARWQRALREEQHATRRTAPMLWPWAVAAALGALALWPVLRRDEITPPAIVATQDPVAPATTDGDALLSRNVRAQLTLARAELPNLAARTPQSRRALVQRWIDDQRALARAADAAGDAQLARTLRAFEPLLQDLARDAPGTGHAGRDQLAFEWAVMQTKLAPSPSKPLPNGI